MKSAAAGIGAATTELRRQNQLAIAYLKTEAQRGASLIRQHDTTHNDEQPRTQHNTAGETNKKLSDTGTVTTPGQATSNRSVTERGRATHDDLRQIRTTPDLGEITVTKLHHQTKSRALKHQSRTYGQERLRRRAVWMEEPPSHRHHHHLHLKSGGLD